MSTPHNYTTLLEFAQVWAYCPCCAESETCVPDCTFEDDCPEEWREMMEARAAIAGPRQDQPLSPGRPAVAESGATPATAGEPSNSLRAMAGEHRGEL